MLTLLTAEQLCDICHSSSFAFILFGTSAVLQLAVLQEFGSPSKNGLNHKVTQTIDPATLKQVDAVFMPKKPAGQWSGEIAASAMVTSEAVVDDDTNALRKNQLYLSSSG